MSDTGDNVTDEAKREEAREEEEERQKQKEKEEQREREEKERKQKEETQRKEQEEKDRKDKEEKDRKDKEEKDRKDREEKDRKDREEQDKKDREEKENEEKEAEREYDTASEEGKAKQREFYKAELMRLEKGLKYESLKIIKPKVKNYSPFVFTTLEPYYNTYVPNFLIDLPNEDPQMRPISRGKLYAEDPRPGYVSRNTAIGLCDPWTDLRMDRELLPRLSTPASKSRKKPAGGKKRKDKKERPPKEGSTRLPKFPVVDFNTNKENATKQFLYSEVPRFRQEMAGRYSQTAPKKIETDYTRTRQDFYRMNLDRLDEIHPTNRPHMRQAYFAYLQNTPGSKKAVKECVKGLEKDPQAQQAH